MARCPCRTFPGGGDYHRLSIFSHSLIISHAKRIVPHTISMIGCAITHRPLVRPQRVAAVGWAVESAVPLGLPGAVGELGHLASCYLT